MDSGHQTEEIQECGGIHGEVSLKVTLAHFMEVPIPAQGTPRRLFPRVKSAEEDEATGLELLARSTDYLDGDCTIRYRGPTLDIKDMARARRAHHRALAGGYGGRHGGTARRNMSGMDLNTNGDQR